MKKPVIVSLALFVPFLALAVTIADIISRVRDVVNLVIPVLMLVAVAVFIWGIVMFISSADNEDKRRDAKNYIIYGLIGIFVMVAFWGIIQVVLNTFLGGSPGSAVPFPQITPPSTVDQSSYY